jgi:hyperosmotically inducible periplasmic protein
MKTVAVVITAVLVAPGSASSQQASSEPMSGREELKTERAIQARLQKEPDLKSNRIDVEVENGFVTLNGKVDSEAERTQAEKAAWVNGVTRVNDWLVVGRAAKKARSDSAVTAEIEAQYRADKTLGHADVSVDMNDGVVTLAGVIPSESARQRAIDIAEKSPGVKQVEDELRAAGEVAPMPPPIETPHR